MTPSSKTMKSELARRIAAADGLLIEGIKSNNPEMVETAITALSQAKDFAVEHAYKDLVKGVKDAIFHKIAGYSLIDAVIKRKIHEEILEQFLLHANLNTKHVINVNFSRMNLRTSAMIAESFIKGAPKGDEHYQDILSAFEDKKHHGDWKKVYAHLLNATLDADRARYRDKHMGFESNIFAVVYGKTDTPLTHLACEVLMENQDAVLAHLKRQKALSPNVCPINVMVVIQLYQMGFTRLPDAWGPELFFENSDPRQLLKAEKAGITIDKQLVIDKLTFSAYSDCNEPHAEYTSRMDLDALVYMLESDTFELQDLKDIKARIKGDKSKVITHLNSRVAHDLVYALKAVYSEKRAETSDLLIKKTKFMITWGMESKHPSYRDQLGAAMVELHHMPRHIVHRYPSLRDDCFAVDLGL